ncbi:ATP-binding protein [Sphingomonas sp. ID1715]|uniref:ATP-binding protein n=1 Tax=Sphingomonas sp. ID1715 TaxID=1656898 RepID=UPI0034A01A29
MIARWQRVPQAAAGIFAVLLLLLGVLVVTQADRDYRFQQEQRAQIRARILAGSATAAVDFHDLEAAREAVNPFGVDPQARAVALYDERGALLTGFGRAGVMPPARFVEGSPPSGLALGVADIVSGGRRIGRVLILSEIEPFARRLSRYTLITVLSVMAASIVLILGLSQSALRRKNGELEASNRALIEQMAQREKVEGELRQVQKMESIGQLTGGIAHDFNNMLAIVIGSLDIAERRFATNPDRARQAIGHALEGANRAASLTKRLLAFARRSPLQPQAIDANQLVSGMSELLRRTLGEGVSIETVLAGGLWRTHADPGQLENAVLNLSVNSRDAMDGHGRLTIETMNAHLDDAYAARHDGVAAGQYVAVVITDNGPGMPQEVIDRAFEPFFTTKGVGKGTGLGLAQVYGFVRQSGGHVKIYSELGQGTSIKIYLPRHLGPADTGRAEPMAMEVPRARAGELILVVEDEEQVRRMSLDALEELGYRVIEAVDGEHALELVRARPDIRLLFTDVVMPGINGRELADQARLLRPDLPVLFTTGYTRNAVVHNGIVDSDVFFIPKPFTVEQLGHKLRSVLDRG